MGNPALERVIINLCTACIDGAGEECHTAGCALFLHRVDLPIPREVLTPVDGATNLPPVDLGILAAMLLRSMPNEIAEALGEPQARICARYLASAIRQQCLVAAQAAVGHSESISSALERLRKMIQEEVL